MSPTPIPDYLMIGSPFAARHTEILVSALELIAERGVDGASLRELADRVGIKQPSLYHYFASKDELIDQVIELMGGNMMHPGNVPLPTTLEELPAFLGRFAFDLWERDPLHLWFTWFMFAVAIGRPERRGELRRMFLERFEERAGLLLHPWVSSGEISAEDAYHVCMLVTRSIGLALIEHRIIYDVDEPRRLRRFGDFVVEAAVHTIRARRSIPGAQLADVLDRPAEDDPA